ncbi:hypothetical protein COBT_002153 [Conglomerata obtusa]
MNHNGELRSDMASALAALRTFEGKDNEDINGWLKEAGLIASMANLRDEELLKLVVLRLRGKAQSWAAETFSIYNNIDIFDFKCRIESRFQSTTAKHGALKKFLSFPNPSTKTEYDELLHLASTIIENGGIKLEELLKLLIQKLPESIKTYLVTAANKSKMWSEFLKEAEEISWVAFKEDNSELFIGEIKKGTSKKYPPHNGLNNEKWSYNKNKFCKVHGNGSHDSKECKTLDEIEKRGYIVVKRKEVKCITEEVVNEINKHELNYIKYFHTYNNFVSDKSENFYMQRKENIFEVNFFYLNTKYKGIIDTGADVSLICKNTLPKEVTKTAKHKVDYKIRNRYSNTDPRICFN